MPRLLRYSSGNYDNLVANGPHRFAQRHALSIYPSDAIYSFIPKNGCSTMRTSLAIANGCIAGSADFNWIHQNNDAFSASLAELAKARYTFTILRCPFARLLSVYLDKIVNRYPVAWRYLDLHRRAIDIEDVTFEFFVKSMSREHIRLGDIHWTPQARFLVYADYDDYFAFEEFPTLVAALKRNIGLEVVDARPLTRHATSGFRKLSRKEPFRLAPLDLLGYRQRGSVPTLQGMYNDELVACVRRAYREDIALYKARIGTAHLLDY